jgi:IclR family acetate operon transcriptional repressor
MKNEKHAEGSDSKVLLPRVTRIPGGNHSVARALTILIEVARSPTSLSFVDLQKRLSFPKATLHKLLLTLEKTKFLRRNSETAKYSIGISAMELTAASRVRPGDLRSVLDSILHNLVDEWNETCHLSVLDGGDEIVLDSLNSLHQVVRLATVIGGRQPAYVGAGGLGALALLPNDEVLARLPAKLRPFTKNTIRTRTQLLARLNEIREKGYALHLEEAHMGVRCVGVAVAVPGWPIFALCFSLPLQRASMERLRELAKPLMAAAKEAESILRLTPRP